MARFRELYGAGVLHLLVMLPTLAVAAYAVLTLLVGDPSLVRVAVWFLAAVVANDLVLNPVAAVLDGVLRGGLRWLPRLPASRTTINYIRVPALGAALTFLVYFPGIVRQGEPVVLGQSGLDQSPFLLRWLLLVAGMVALSIVVFRLARRRHRVRTAATSRSS